jgi:hypothetical protein
MEKIRYKKESGELFRLAVFSDDIGIRINMPKLRKALGIQKQFTTGKHILNAIKGVTKLKG